MYEQTASAVTSALTNTNGTIFDTETVNLIVDLVTSGTDTQVTTEAVSTTGGQVTVAAGTELAYVQTSNTAVTTVTAPTDVKVVLFQGAGGVVATFNGTGTGSEAGTADRVVVGTAAADNIVIADAKNTQVTAGAGDTVVAGAGFDTIVAGLGDSTVQGGTGFAIVELGGNQNDYTVTVSNGAAVVTNANGTKTTVDGIQFIQLDNGNALVLAKDAVEAAVTAIYEATFGRSADAYGLDFWFDRVRDGVSLDAIADAFVNSAEYQSTLGTSTNAQFVNTLFQNVFGRAATQADLDFYTAQLAAGSADRGDIIVDLVNVVADTLTGESNDVVVIGGISIVNGII